jgi:1,4-dihydroxy-2-naphthoyl-CoA hydrolase
VPTWVSPLTLEQIAATSRATASGHLGIVFTALGDDWLEGTIPLDAQTRDADGALHHGALAILAETLGSLGATMCVDLSRQACLGQILHLQHTEPAHVGPVTGRAAPLAIQGQSQLWEIQIRDGTGARVCIAQLTLAVIDRPSTPVV